MSNGKVLGAGKTEVTTAVGQHRFDHQDLLKYSINYRFGVANRFWFFEGADLGWHLEAPTNPGTMEFELRLGLPLPVLQANHSLGLGWGIGMWADNSLFLDYAAGWHEKRYTLFTNTRLTRVATQAFELLEEDLSQPLRSSPKWVIQTGLGVEMHLPNWFLLPNSLIPQAIVTFPEIPAGPNAEEIIREPQIQGNLGFAWNF